jgi:hypothetical protein
LRELALADTNLAPANAMTIRVKPRKIGAAVIRNIRYIRHPVRFTPPVAWQ